MKGIYVHILDHQMIAGRWYYDRDFDNIFQVGGSLPWPMTATINFNTKPQSATT